MHIMFIIYDKKILKIRTEIIQTLLINVGFICTVGRFASKNLDAVN